MAAASIPGAGRAAATGTLWASAEAPVPKGTSIALSGEDLQLHATVSRRAYMVINIFKSHFPIILQKTYETFEAASC